MKREHLTADEVAAIARGETVPDEVDLHTRGCDACRETVADALFEARYGASLGPDHPDEDLLTALWSRALSPSRKADVEAHLELCARCRDRLSGLERDTAPDSHPGRVSERKIARMQAWAVEAATGPRRATLVVRVTDALKRARLAFDDLGNRLLPGEPPVLLRRAFAPPESNRRALFSVIDEAHVLDDAIPVGEAGPRALHDLLAGARSADDTTALSDGRRTFEFRSEWSAEGARLVVGFTSARDERSASPVAAVLESKGQPPRREAIALEDEVVFPLRPGGSVLILELDPPWRIEIDLRA